jgi:hypothetical protein
VSIVVDITEISAMVAAAGVIVGVALTFLELRHLREQRQTDLVNRLYSAFISPEFLDASLKFGALEFKDYEDFVKKYGPIFHVGKYGITLGDYPELRAFLMVDNFFNQVGILLYRGFIDAGLLRDVFTYRVELCWKKVEPIVQGLRKEFNQPEAGKWFEYLYNEMKKREQKLQEGAKNG